ncbi:MAG: WD40 repeat domain-containing protein, partial [Bacteroidota bacterium]
SDRNIYFVDAQNLSIKHTITQAHDSSVFSLYYHVQKQQLFSGGRDAYLKIWQLNSTYDCKSSQAAHLFTINAIAFHPEEQLFATASRDKTIKIWDSHTFKLLKVIETIRDDGHLNSVNALYWSTHKNYLLSASDDRTICAWKVNI